MGKKEKIRKVPNDSNVYFSMNNSKRSKFLLIHKSNFKSPYILHGSWAEMVLRQKFHQPNRASFFLLETVVPTTLELQPRATMYSTIYVLKKACACVDVYEYNMFL